MRTHGSRQRHKRKPRSGDGAMRALHSAAAPRLPQHIRSVSVGWHPRLNSAVPTGRNRPTQRYVAAAAFPQRRRSTLRDEHRLAQLERQNREEEAYCVGRAGVVLAPSEPYFATSTTIMMIAEDFTMIRVVSLALLALTVLPVAAHAFEVRATIKRVDSENARLTFRAPDGRERTAKVAADAAAVSRQRPVAARRLALDRADSAQGIS